MSELQQACKALVDFACDNSSRFRSETHILEVDGAVDHHLLTNVFGLPNAHLMAGHWHLFDSVLPKRFTYVHVHSIKLFLRQMVCATS